MAGPRAAIERCEGGVGHVHFVPVPQHDTGTEWRLPNRASKTDVVEHHLGIVEAVQILRAAGPLRPRIAALPAPYRWGLYYAAATVLLFGAQSRVPFIYFRF